MGDKIMKAEKKSTRKILETVIAVAITVLLILPGSMLTNSILGTTIITASSLDATVAEWNVTLNFNETGGKMDYVVFGEAVDANDGEPPDIHDAPKPPSPMQPYLRAWFDDNLSAPYGKLWEDFRRYPGTEKTWELYVIWKCSISNLTNITISWDIGRFTGCEYNSVVLWRYDPFDDEWDFAADMLVATNYIYEPRWFNGQWLTDQFQIIAGVQDTTPPETTYTLEGEKEGDLYVGPVTVTLNATDDMSGVNYTMYQLDGDIWQEYNNPFVVSDYGEHIVWFYSVDLAGNVEAEKNCTFTIKTPDITPPVTTCTLDGELVGGVYVSNVTVTLTATDDMSGVNYTMYKINDGIWQEYSSPFVVSENGTYTIYFYSVDNAENVEPEKNIIFIIDLSDIILKASLIVGQIRNFSIINNFIVFNAVSVRYFSFFPFDFGIYDSGEQIIVSNRFIGLLTFRFIFGFFKADFKAGN
jgi:hypothetical protein